MGFFILLKGYKSNNVFANFYYNSYKDDFIIFILVRLLKAGFNKFIVLERITSKPSLYKFKDCYRSKVLKGVNIGNNGFKDPNSWKSIERRLYMPEDRFYKPVES